MRKQKQIHVLNSDTINVSGLDGCSSRCHEEILQQHCDLQYDQGTGCEVVLADIHSADEYVVQAGWQQHPAG